MGSAQPMHRSFAPCDPCYAAPAIFASSSSRRGARRDSSSSSSCRPHRVLALPAGLALLLSSGTAAAQEVVPIVQEERSWKEAYRLANEKLNELDPWELHRLVNGLGWHRPFTWTPGYYVGNIAGNPHKDIPWLKMQDSGNGFRTMLHSAAGSSVVWPSPLAAASTWDEESLEQQAVAMGREFRSKEANVILGPAVNVHRVARGGRNFEYLSGEDPYLGAVLTRAFVRGVQSQGVMAVVKHFAFNEQEAHRGAVDSEVDDRTAWELYYPPFEAAVDAGAGAFMCSYNRVNGTHACASAALLKRDLKEKMGFSGFVMSDWGATHMTALSEGLDMDQPGFDPYYHFNHVRKHEQDLNNSARRVLASMYRLRLDQQPPGCKPPMCFATLSKNVTTAEHIALARKIATSAVVLLKNSGVLPVDVSRVKKIGILGKAADAKVVKVGTRDPNAPGLPKGDYYSGGGSGHVQGIDGMTATTLDAICTRAKAAGIEVLSANTTFQHESSRTTEEVLLEADLLIVVGGALTVESLDRKSLNLDSEADNLIEGVAKLKPTVVLLMVPGAILMPWREEVSAIATLFYGGQETGTAWASVLFGDATPGGKLPIMMPETEADTIEPSEGPVANYSEGLATSYRSSEFQAAFPFGHGLSYTTFSTGKATIQVNHFMWLEHVRLSPHPQPPGPPGRVRSASDIFVQVEVPVQNIGRRPGTEVIQAYLEFPNAPPGTPTLQLRGFRKTKELAGGEQEVAKLKFGPRDFATYTPSEGWRVQDRAILRLGTSSRRLMEPVLLKSIKPEPLFTAATTTTADATAVAVLEAPVTGPPHAQPVTSPPSAKLVTGPPHAQPVTSPPSAKLVSGPPPVKLRVPPSEANNWILWFLQPLLLLLVILIAWCATRGVELEDDDDEELQEKSLPSILMDAEEFKPYDFAHYSEDGVTAPLVGPL